MFGYLETRFTSAVPYLIGSRAVALLDSLFTVLVSLPSAYEVERKGA